MNIVMTWTQGDGCTYSCDVTQPIRYESLEAAIVEFETAAKLARKQMLSDWRHSSFEFAGYKFWTEQFFESEKFYSPDFYSLEEWFEKEAP